MSRQISSAEIQSALYETGGNISQAAKLIGCRRETIWHRLRKEPELAEHLRRSRHQGAAPPLTEEQYLYQVLTGYIDGKGLPSAYHCGVFGFLDYLRKKTGAGS